MLLDFRQFDPIIAAPEYGFRSNNMQLEFGLDISVRPGVRSFNIGAPTLSVASSQLIIRKEAARRRPRYIDSLRQYLAKFCKGREHQLISEITTAHIEDWFAFRNEAPATMNSNLGRLSALFSFAVRRGWIVRNPCDAVEKQYVDRERPKILTLGQCELLMRRAMKLEPSIVPHLALALFCGVRPEEIKRLTGIPADRFLFIPSSVSKTRSHRLVAINETARAWIKNRTRLNHRNWRRKLFRVRHDFKVVNKKGRRKWFQVIPWSHDVLRHTAASMLYATHGAVITARELGHSESVLHRHYREIVTQEDARKFWSILPTIPQTQ